MPKTIYTNLTDLTRDKRSTFLSEDVVATGSTIRVQSIIGFETPTTSSGQILIIGNIGDEKTEIIRTSATAYPSQTYKDITTRSGDTLIFDHPQDTKVYIVDWDRVQVRWAATVNGTKATLVAYPEFITPDVPEMLFVDTSSTAGYYFSRFNNTIRDASSDDSDAIPFGGFGDNTVFMIKKRAIDELGDEVDGKIITHEFLNQSLWEARREYHQSRGKRPFRRKFNTDIGNALTGSSRIDLPTDVEKPHTSENVFGVRIGANANMSYYDKKEWDFDWRNKPRTTLAHLYTYNTSTSVWLANGRDFGDSAVISVEGINISVTRIAGLTGDSFLNSFRIYSHPSPGYDVSAGSEAYENVSYGLPDKFTVFQNPEGSAYVYFNRPIDTAYINQNIYADYYRTLVGYDSDADELDEPKFDLYVHYLKAKIKHRRNRGEGDLTQDPDYKIWLSMKAEALANENLMTEVRISPEISHLTLPE